MQIWVVESKHLGVLRVTYDESAIGQNIKSNQITGAITSLDMNTRARPFKSSSKEYANFLKCLRAYESGNFAAFDHLSLAFQGTDFQNRVLTQMRLIQPGSVVTYSDLASLAGRPKAHRAVATVCATNKIPLLIPCHRVVPSDLTIGNYASRKMANGRKLKERLLLHEGALRD